MSVKLFADSACDLTLAEAKNLGITLLPLKVRIDGMEYLDGVSITLEEYYEKLAHGKKLPTTRPVSAVEFIDVLEALLQPGDEAVIVTIAGKLSTTVQNAVDAASRLDGNVWVVDSGSATIGEGILLRYAIRLRDRGLSGRQIAAELERAKHHIRLLVRMESLDYLKRGGHISTLKAFTGTIMQLKPVVSMEDGEVRVLGNAKGPLQSDNLLAQFIHEAGGIDFSMPMMVAYAGPDDTLLREYIDNSQELWKDQMDPLPVSAFHSTVCSHAGPGAIALAFFTNKYRLYHW